MITTDTRKDAPVPAADAENKFEYFIKCPYCGDTQVSRLYRTGVLGEQGSDIHICASDACAKPFVVSRRVDVEATSYKIEGY